MAILGPCLCLNSRTGTLLCGFFDVVIGLTGLSYMLMLDATERHILMDPSVLTQQELETLRYDNVKDTFQFLIEFWLPSLSLFLLGIILIFASITKSSCMVVSSFVFSTILIAGSLAGLLCLFLSGANWIGLMPYFFVTVLQCFFYAVVVDFSRYAWEQRHCEDKEMLVISSKA